METNSKIANIYVYLTNYGPESICDVKYDVSYA